MLIVAVRARRQEQGEKKFISSAGRATWHWSMRSSSNKRRHNPVITDSKCHLKMMRKRLLGTYDSARVEFIKSLHTSTHHQHRRTPEELSH